MERRLSRGSALNLSASAAALLFIWSNAGEATAGQFDCTLTTLESTANPNFTGAESRSMAVSVDQGAKTIIVSQDGTDQSLDHVTFSQLTINGYTDTLSLGMDKSSGNIVLQTYGPNAAKTEFGTCRVK